MCSWVSKVSDEASIKATESCAEHAVIPQRLDNAKHTFRIDGMVTAGGLKFSSGSPFLDFEIMRGLMLRKMVMMRMFIGNMRRPLCTPTMSSCQVICNEPGEAKNE